MVLRGMQNETWQEIISSVSVLPRSFYLAAKALDTCISVSPMNVRKRKDFEMGGVFSSSFRPSVLLFQRCSMVIIPESDFVKSLQKK